MMLSTLHLGEQLHVIIEQVSLWPYLLIHEFLPFVNQIAILDYNTSFLHKMKLFQCEFIEFMFHLPNNGILDLGHSLR